MKYILLVLFSYVAGFDTAYFWDADIQKRVAQDRDLAKRRWAEVYAEADKDGAILKKIDAARDKISDCLGIPREDPDSDPLNLDTPTPTPTPNK
jgi:hypothetical protein